MLTMRPPCLPLCIIKFVNILCAPIVNKDFTFTNCNCLFSGKTEPHLATHVLQFVFLSDSGFRFPIAQFSSAECTPSDLYFNFWRGVRTILEFRFV